MPAPRPPRSKQAGTPVNESSTPPLGSEERTGDTRQAPHSATPPPPPRPDHDSGGGGDGDDAKRAAGRPVTPKRERAVVPAGPLEDPPVAAGAATAGRPGRRRILLFRVALLRQVIIIALPIIRGSRRGRGR